MRVFHAGIAVVLLSAAPLLAQTAAQPKVVLVELFTSEGCSSCPPADALLRQVEGTRPNGDQLIVGISEHVTYWNSLGWADAFSASIYTERQNAYGSHFGLSDVYTPQMVVNGATQFVGSDKRNLDGAIAKERTRPVDVSLHILSVTPAGTRLSVTFTSSSVGTVHAADIFAVLADDMAQSNVLRGENSGRTLSHVAVARSLVRVGKLQPGVEQTVQIDLPVAARTRAGHHLIVFAQEGGTGRVLGADSRPLVGGGE